MKRGFLILDLETVPDRALYSPPEAKPGDVPAFPPLWAHQPIVIGALWLDERYRFQRIGTVGEGKEEPAMLADLAGFVDRERPRLVTWNGRSFDLPVIALRCMRHGIPLRFYFQDRDYRQRYSDEGHLDLCDLLAEHGAARAIGLDPASRLIGLPGKTGIDGSQVEALFSSGQLQAIRDYCLSDVAQTAFLLLRYRLVQGALTADGYRSAAGALFEALSGDARTANLCLQIDRQRLLSTYEG
jgi:predicted PolB exonuclease-like 3'-5' exonuclease